MKANGALPEPYDWGPAGVPAGKPLVYAPGQGWLVDAPPPRPPTEINPGESGVMIAFVGLAGLSVGVLLIVLALGLGWL